MGGKCGFVAGNAAGHLPLDRAQPAAFPFSRWQHDPFLHYKHRPGIYGWGPRHGRKPIYINQYGFHDQGFPEKKADGELRGRILGDSIVMGHDVTAAETFANQLGRLLPEEGVPGYHLYQVINIGVQGYSTFQYLETPKRHLNFSPDFIVGGFCMNDVTEPSMVNAAYGRNFGLGAARGTGPFPDVASRPTGAIINNASDMLWIKNF